MQGLAEAPMARHLSPRPYGCLAPAAVARPPPPTPPLTVQLAASSLSLALPHVWTRVPSDVLDRPYTRSLGGVLP